MSWTDNDGTHEGWDAAVFPGERYGEGSSDSGALVRHFAPGPLRDQRQDESETVDGRTAIGWRGLCECGWRGPLWERVATPAEHDPAARRVYDADPDPTDSSAPAEVEAAIHHEWRGHLEPPALADVRAAARAVDAATARLDAAVAAARADRRSWADIGTAAGITRQSAHERWARTTVPAQP